MRKEFKAHPWHGVEMGDHAPEVLTAYIEIVPSDTVKYELDKQSGILKIDRPQKFSNNLPAVYGFVPQTYCGDKIAALCAKQTGLEIAKGDGDPLDICVLTEHNIPHGDILLECIPIGGLKLIDKGEADDKIISVLKGDAVYGHCKDIKDLPFGVLDRLKHYFLTYKLPPGKAESETQIALVYGMEAAHEVVKVSGEDYWDSFPK